VDALWIYGTAYKNTVVDVNSSVNSFNAHLLVSDASRYATVITGQEESDHLGLHMA